MAAEIAALRAWILDGARPFLTSSFALGLGAHHVTLDAFVPGGDVRAVAGTVLGP